MTVHSIFPNLWFGSVTATDKGEGPWGVSPVGVRNAAVRDGVWQGGPSEVDGPDAALVTLEEVLNTHTLGKCLHGLVTQHRAGGACWNLGWQIHAICFLCHLSPTNLWLAKQLLVHAWAPLPLSTRPPAHRSVLVSQLEQL